MSFASYRNLTDLWGSLHLKESRLNGTNLQNSNEKFQFSKRNESGNKFNKFYSHREMGLKESQVISNVAKWKNEVEENGEEKETKSDLKRNGGNKSIKFKSILKKKVQRKVDIEKLNEFYTHIKKEFLIKKKNVHIEKGIPKIIQNDCHTYLLKTGGELTRNIFWSIRRKREETRMGNSDHPFGGVHVQRLFRKGQTGPLLSNHKCEALDGVLRSGLSFDYFSDGAELHRKLQIQGHFQFGDF